MAERGIEPLRAINEPNLFGYVYEMNGRTVLSVKVEPQLYADRAGEFVSAVLGQSRKPRSLFFTGTAGSLRRDIQVVLSSGVFRMPTVELTAVDGVPMMPSL